MSTPAYVKKLLGVTASGDILYRDRIMDAGFVAHFDFISDYCNQEILTGDTGQEFLNLVDGGAVASVTGDLTDIDANGLDFAASTAKVRLPATFNLASGELHFAVGMVVTFPAPPGASKSVAMAGYAYQTSTDCQWAFTALTNGSSVYSSLRFYANGAAVAFTADLSFMTDGLPHFLVGEYIHGGGSTAIRNLYVDGVLVATSTLTTSATMIQVANSTAIAAGPVIGVLAGFTDKHTGHVGRIWLKKWASGGASITAADIARREYAYYGPTGAAAAMFGSNTASLVGAVDAARFT